MHYTSLDNIHKVIDPLFLNELKEELASITNDEETKYNKRARDKLRAFQDKLASLKFLDPACGSGNFLTETFISLRRLENEVLRHLGGDMQDLFMAQEGFSPVKVQLKQFYGIEINDFAVTVAKTALWIAESQLLQETESILGTHIDFLPLKTYANNIVEGNALRMDWNDVIPASELNYIMGNPPFVGARWKSPEQKQDVLSLFTDKWKNWGNLDYVCCWFKKASDLMKGTKIRTAFVATNSICQGESVGTLWKNLMKDGLMINFAWRTFVWDSDASEKAHVHCVIVGFSYVETEINTLFFDDQVKNFKGKINCYLTEGCNIFIENRQKAICDVPEIGIGNQPIDDGNYLFSYDEMVDFISKEPNSKRYFRPWYGADELIKQKPRYCLWLGECSPSELKSMPNCLERVLNVKKFRLNSKRSQTLKLADTPTRFCVENFPSTNYIAIPEISSEKRKYVPMGFLTPNEICSNRLKLVPNATLYHFGVLESSTRKVPIT